MPMPCWSSLVRHWLVDWLVLRKCSGIVVAFVLVHLLSRYSVCWSSASARRDKARHSLFLRLSGGIMPLSTDSMIVGVDRIIPYYVCLHTDTCRTVLTELQFVRQVVFP